MRQKNCGTPCFIHIDEAHIFCPGKQPVGKHSRGDRSLYTGTKRGFAAVLATQRLPKLNKDATAECNNKMIGRSAQDIDRKRAGEELGMNSKADILAIRDLQPGQFFAFGPAISSQVIEFKVSLRHHHALAVRQTYDHCPSNTEGYS